MAASSWRLGRDRSIVLGGLALVCFVGWLMLVRLGSSGMEMGPTPMGMAGTLMPPSAVQLPGYGLMLAMWMVMMVAMMAPAAAPGATAYLVLAQRCYPGKGTALLTLALSAGYFAAWLGYALLGASAQWVFTQSMLLTPMGTLAAPYLSSALLVLIGAYQLTPLKRICVTRCRQPLLQLIASWRDGISGAFRLGLDQGRWCVGCCWALMALLFVTGVMNLAWMAILSAFVLAEKLVPASWRVDTAAGLLLLGWGAWPLLSALFTGLWPAA